MKIEMSSLLELEKDVMDSTKEWCCPLIIS